MTIVVWAILDRIFSLGWRLKVKLRLTFASYELSDRNGIFLGLNLYNRSPVFLDPFDDYKYTIYLHRSGPVFAASTR